MPNPSLKLPFLVFGAGGHASVVLDICEATRKRPTLILDDLPQGREFFGIKVTAPNTVDWPSLGQFEFIVALGDNKLRASLFHSLATRGGLPISLIHPFSCLSPSAVIGPGSVIMPGAIINAHAQIGENCIINTGARIDHDCHIGPHSHICPGVTLAGSVRVDESVFIGAGAVCIPGVRIGARATIGAGSVVVRNIPADATAFGNPARPAYRK